MAVNIPISKPKIGSEELKAVESVISSGFLVQGKKTLEVEEYFAKKFNRKFAVMTTSGTSALTTVTSIIDLMPGDEVITSAFTFFASASCIAYAGATPVFADIDSDTFNISSEDLERRITKKTRAIIAVDLFGLPFDYHSISKIAKKNKLLLVEDAAQAHGAIYDDRLAGSLGDISIFSFYGSKIITCGEGGMILTDNEKHYKRALSYRAHGVDAGQSYYHTSFGYNYRITDIQSALLLEQAKKLDKFVALRNIAAEYYSKKLKKIEGIKTPVVKKGFKQSFSCYTIRINPKFGKRNEVLKRLNEAGIGARVYYPSILPVQPVWKKLGYKFASINYPEASKASEEVLSLPIFPDITRREQNYVIKMLSTSLG